jgi:chromosome segregation ATPase
MVTKLTISRQEKEIQQLKEAIEHHKKEMADFKASIDPKTRALIDRERRALPWTKDQLTAARTQLHHANSRIADLEYYRKGFQATITSLQNEKENLRSENSRLEKKSRKADGKDEKIKGMEKELKSREKKLNEALKIQASTSDELEESKKAAQQTEAALQEAQDILLEKNTTINALKVTVDKEKASADMCRRAMKRTPMFPEHNIRMLKDLRKKFDVSIPDPTKVVDDLLSEPITRLPTLADCRIPCQQPSVHSFEKDEAVAPPKVEQNTSPKAVPVAQSLWNRWAGWLWNSGEKNVA